MSKPDKHVSKDQPVLQDGDALPEFLRETPEQIEATKRYPGEVNIATGELVILYDAADLNRAFIDGARWQQHRPTPAAGVTGTKPAPDAMRVR